MSYNHAMIQVLAVDGPVMVALLKNDSISALNTTNMNPKQWDIIDEMHCKVNGDIKLISGMSYYLGEMNFKPSILAQKDFGAIDEAKVALLLTNWLEGVNKNKNRIIELDPVLMPLKILANILHLRSSFCLPDFDLIAMMNDLILLADYQIRQNLAENAVELPEILMSFDEQICPATLAAEMGLSYYEKMITGFAHEFTGIVKERCLSLVSG